MTPMPSIKIMRHTKTQGIAEFRTQQRLTHIHVDIIRTPVSPWEFTVISSDIRQNNRWSEAIPVRQQIAESCETALIDWASRHGIPQYITSDRGANFTFTLWSSLATSLGTKLIHTTAYNPEVNGMVEQLHRSLKSSLTARCQGGSWRKELPWVLLKLRTAPHAAFNTWRRHSVSVDNAGRRFQDTAECMTLPDVCRALENIMPMKTTHYVARKKYISEDLKTAKYVFIKTDAYKPPSSPANSGPHCMHNTERKHISPVDRIITKIYDW
ncbi:uncharacterized protein [Macrobrachium rosenbergii]|uniref:uncharacterized protein n=1 Tax=Macrobrachium rosenbergii TaxID=79674 RepID=UPI0034D43DFE